MKKKDNVEDSAEEVPNAENDIPEVPIDDDDAAAENAEENAAELQNDDADAAAEISDDYDEVAGVENATTLAEESDAYDENNSAATVDQLDAGDGQEKSEVDEEEEKEEETSMDAKVAGGLAGAAILSSAGIFIWVRKSNKPRIQSVNSRLLV